VVERCGIVENVQEHGESVVLPCELCGEGRGEEMACRYGWFGCGVVGEEGYGGEERLVYALW